MFKALQALLKKPQTIIGIVTALMFQVIFSVIWMTAYSGVNDRASELTIAIVNEDGARAEELTSRLAASLPFHTVLTLSPEQAAGQLEQRDLHMILQIPSGFTEQLSTPGAKAAINYTINEANPVTIKSIMQGAAANITSSVNSQAAAQGTQAILIQSGTPAEQAAAAAGSLISKVEGTTTSLHPVNGMNNQMVPMMVVLASFVGSMIMGLNLQVATGMLSTAYSRWKLFGARFFINIGSALAVSLLGSSLIVALGGQTQQGFLAFWLFQALFVATFMFFSQIFLIAFGAAGSLFNIIMLSLQLVSSGAMVPRELLSGFYRFIGDVLPATYAVKGVLSVQLGGPGAQSAAGSLVLVLAVAIGVSALITLLKKAPSPVEAPAASASPSAAVQSV
ncbi:DUF3533 domain-containing protein [Paenibacillus albidus]|uniref:YhgE/Pip domain-containing protein n=1 Tax=Paenibacillus albidus TaxID=2041023 RepID=UPI001BE63C25|nr:ABC transporter permease [Paenibacillus albidus]MBT2290526.1 DUF3533 domain-containing protein [Paenibacillus albidus]